MVLELLAALIGTVFFLHRHGPDAARHAAHHGVFRVHAVAEEKAQIRSEIVNVHAARQIGFDKRQAIAERESQLADGVGPGLGNVVTADGRAVNLAATVKFTGRLSCCGLLACGLPLTATYFDLIFWANSRATCYPQRMTPKELANHKAVPKRLAGLPLFKTIKRGKFPKPLHKMGGLRIQATDLINVSDAHCIVFIWRDGELRTDSAFFAYLFCVLGDGGLYPLFEMHFHPSHKGLHGKVPCNTASDFTSRMLPGAPELALSSRDGLDPRVQGDRNNLIERFCLACGVAMGTEGGLWN